MLLPSGSRPSYTSPERGTPHWLPAIRIRS
eukprot:COSAG01_NODE_42490_length_439_cov_1.502941_1_plen_29_part_01